MQKCTKCKKEKQLSDFSSNQRQCRVCKSAASKEWNRKNRERRKINNQIWNKKNAPRKREKELLKKYGISSKEYEELAIKQDHKCKICNIEQKDLDKKLSVDHCHKTGKVRGLLCSDCNFMLGHSKDQLDTLMKAIVYLTNNK